MCLAEINYKAFNYKMDARQRTAECFDISRKARKSYIKNENQKRGELNYHKLLSLEISYMVKKEFTVIRRNMRKERQGGDDLLNIGHGASLSDGTHGLMNGNDDTDDLLLNLGGRDDFKIEGPGGTESNGATTSTNGVSKITSELDQVAMELETSRRESHLSQSELKLEDKDKIKLETDETVEANSLMSQELIQRIRWVILIQNQIDW